MWCSDRNYSYTVTFNKDSIHIYRIKVVCELLSWVLRWITYGMRCFRSSTYRHQHILLKHALIRPSNLIFESDKTCLPQEAIAVITSVSLGHCHNVKDISMWLNVLRTVTKVELIEPLLRQTAMPQRLYSAKKCQRAVESPQNVPKTSHLPVTTRRSDSVLSAT